MKEINIIDQKEYAHTQKEYILMMNNDELMEPAPGIAQHGGLCPPQGFTHLGKSIQ